jgi:hypothetical protein
MTAAQKNAQANFKKAIAYRKKTGCSLKEAFAHVKGSVSGLDKVFRKGNKTTVLYTKKTKKKSAPKKKLSQGVLFGVKKKASKKSAVKKLHKDTNSHNVKISVMSGTKKLNTDIFNKLKKVDEDIFINYQFLNDYINAKEYSKRTKNKLAYIQYSKIDIPRVKKLITELKKHKAELKKLL